MKELGLERIEKPSKLEMLARVNTNAKMSTYIDDKKARFRWCVVGFLVSFINFLLIFLQV